MPKYSVFDNLKKTNIVSDMKLTGFNSYGDPGECGPNDCDCDCTGPTASDCDCNCH